MTVYGGPYADGKTPRYFRNRKTGKQVRSSYGNTYVFNNKPNGLLHWAQAHQHDNGNDNEAIVLIDPDFLFLSHFHLIRPDLSVVGQKQQQRQQLRDRDLVHPGQPAAASYGLGAQWLEFDLSKICGTDSPCVNTTQDQVHQYYSAGPPYVIHRSDVLQLAQTWVSLVPATYDEYPLLYAEMYAYSVAAAHLQLRHNLINNIFTGCMVGWPNPNRWGNSNKDQQHQETVALPQSATSYRIQLAEELKEAKEIQRSNIGGTRFPQSLRQEDEQGPTSCFLPGLSPPPFLHYCNRYMIKATTDEMKQAAVDNNKNKSNNDSVITYYFFAKRKVDHANVFSCDNNTTTTTTTTTSHRFLPFPSIKEKEEMANGNEDWNTLAVCAIVRTLNFARNRGCHRRRYNQEEEH